MTPEDSALESYVGRLRTEDTMGTQLLDEESFLTEIAETQMILFGDFHSLPQSQRQFLEILTGFQQRAGHHKAIVCLEMFGVEDQACLNSYITGLIEFQELVVQTQLEKMWPFPIQQ